jgi:hypothetical protein
MDIALLFQHSLVYGLMLSAVMTVSFIVIALINPEIWLKDYPPDIREKFGRMSERAKKQRTLFGIPVALLTLGIIVLAVAQLAQVMGRAPTFLEVAISFFLMLLVFNLVDLFIIDWLIFVTLRPRLIILPGTEGMKGYRDYGFHFKQSLKGLVGSTVASVIVAGMSVLIYTLS